VSFDDFAALPEVENGGGVAGRQTLHDLPAGRRPRSVVIYSVDGGKCRLRAERRQNRRRVLGQLEQSARLVTVSQIKYSLFGDYMPHEYNWMLLVDQNCKNPRMVVPDRSGATNYGSLPRF